MSLKMKLKRIGAMILAVMMMLSGMSFAFAEEVTEIPEETQDDVNELEIPADDTSRDDEQSLESEEMETAELAKESENGVTVVDPVEDEPSEEPDIQESAEPVVEEPIVQISVEAPEEMPAESIEEEPAQTETEAETLVSPLHQVIDRIGYAYIQSNGAVPVYSDKALKELLFNAEGSNVWLAMAYSEKNIITVYGIDDEGTVIRGYIKESALEETPLTEDDVSLLAEDHAFDRKDTDIGEKYLLVISGSWSVTEEINLDDAPEEPDEPVSEADPVPVEEDESEYLPDDTIPEIISDETKNLVDEEPEIVPDNIPDDSCVESAAENTSESGAEDSVPEPDTTEDLTEAAKDNPEIETDDNPPDEAEEPADELPVEIEIIEEPEASETREMKVGDYIFVTTSTRVFSGVDATAYNEGLPRLLEGSFVKDAVVRISAIETDTHGHIWYQVTYQYGDVLASGKQSWTESGSLFVLAGETSITDAVSLTMTDYAYTKEQLQNRSSGRMLMAATPMNGFSLKDISVNLGSFKAGQSGLYGSSGKDSDYPQLAKSSSHGTIYATPHYLSGYTVYCLEHTYDGPGEGTGSNRTPTGPYKLLDLSDYCNTSAGNGVSGFRFGEPTMHAIAWVMRHTYPYMVLDRSDSKNNTWSRAAGQFAIREVIKKLEGSQYVRNYWNMSNFYSFSGGAPSVYLTYARWLATNGIARASITGNITVSDMKTSVSGSNYIGTVTLRTDADLIRIPHSAGTITGNSGGKDSKYYYAKNGDTIQITSTKNTFSVTMESISSEDEEVGFLVAVPSASIQKLLVPIDEGPYPLKSRTLTFELSDGSITVTKKSTDGTLLKGAVIELLSGTSVIATATTGANGQASFASVSPGTYTLCERTAPQGFLLADSNTQSITVTAGVTATATFTNEPVEKKIRINKTDSETGLALSGATFTITRLSGPDSYSATDIGQVVAIITTNTSGIAETGLLPYGEYRITETGVPDGYLDSGFTTTQRIN